MQDYIKTNIYDRIALLRTVKIFLVGTNLVVQTHHQTNQCKSSQ